MTTPICTKCDEQCSINITDEGIGGYTYGSTGGIDEHLVASSDCCDARVMDERGQVITASKYLRAHANEDIPYEADV